MNTTIEMNEKPEYQIANETAQSLFESLNIETSIGAPVADVKEEWPNILYRFTFSRNGKSLSTEYRLGVGHVQWPKRYEDIPAGGDAAVFNTLRSNPNAQLKNKLEHALAAALLARIQKVTPKPHEVLSAICDDGISAHVSSFDDYAANFGMDSDSIKARRIYDHCAELYHKVCALIGDENVTKFAELRAQF